jgi:hypothetical protein
MLLHLINQFVNIRKSSFNPKPGGYINWCFHAARSTNRRESVSMSCRRRSWTLRSFTYKEPETLRAAQELLSADYLWESAWLGGGGRGSQRRQISLTSYPECTKTTAKWLVSCTFWLNNRRKRCFLLRIH